MRYECNPTHTRVSDDPAVYVYPAHEAIAAIPKRLHGGQPSRHIASEWGAFPATPTGCAYVMPHGRGQEDVAFLYSKTAPS